MTDDDLDADFAPVDPVDLVLTPLARGATRREVAAELGVSLAALNHRVVEAVTRRSGEAGTPREQNALLHVGLDELTRRVLAELERDVETAAPLLDVWLGALRLRAGLLFQTRPKDGDR